MFDNNIDNEQLTPDPWTYVHVCTFEQSLKLNELGLYQKSYISWFYYTNSMKKGLDASKHAGKRYRKILSKFGDNAIMELVSAYNVSELGLMLPHGYFSFFDEDLHGWICINQKESVSLISTLPFRTEAEARANKLINLIVDGTVTVDNTNEKYINGVEELRFMSDTDQ